MYRGPGEGGSKCDRSISLYCWLGVRLSVMLAHLRNYVQGPIKRHCIALLITRLMMVVSQVVGGKCSTLTSK